MGHFSQNPDAGRFEWHQDDHISVIKYDKPSPNVYRLTHTHVPKPLEGRGIAGRLAAHALEVIKDEGATFIPLCSYIHAFVKRHPEWEAYVHAE